jgi:hypothetical protein
MLEAVYDKEINIISGNSSGGHSCKPIAHSLKTSDICGILLCDKTAHFKVAFY